MADFAQELARLASDIVELRSVTKATEGKIDEMRVAITKLTEAMTAIVRLEVEFKQHAIAMNMLQSRQDSLDSRIDSIDRELPGLRELRGWVIRALTLVVGAVGMSVIGLVLVKH